MALKLKLGPLSYASATGRVTVGGKRTKYTSQTRQQKAAAKKRAEVEQQRKRDWERREWDRYFRQQQAARAADQPQATPRAADTEDTQRSNGQRASAPATAGPAITLDGRLAAAPPPQGRHFGPGPMTDKERRFYTLREAGYKGPINQDGWPCDERGRRTPEADAQAARHLDAAMKPKALVRQQRVQWLGQEETRRIEAREAANRGARRGQPATKPRRQRAPECGARTQDGTRCKRRGNCPDHR